MKSSKILLVGAFLALGCMCSVSFSAMADTVTLGSECPQVKVIGFDTLGFEVTADELVIVNNDIEIVMASSEPPGSEERLRTMEYFQTLTAAVANRNYEEVGWRYQL